MNACLPAPFSEISRWPPPKVSSTILNSSYFLILVQPGFSVRFINTLWTFKQNPSCIVCSRQYGGFDALQSVLYPPKIGISAVKKIRSPTGKSMFSYEGWSPRRVFIVFFFSLGVIISNWFSKTLGKTRFERNGKFLFYAKATKDVLPHQSATVCYFVTQNKDFGPNRTKALKFNNFKIVQWFRSAKKRIYKRTC